MMIKLKQKFDSSTVAVMRLVLSEVITDRRFLAGKSVTPLEVAEHKIRLFGPVFKPCNPAGVFPQLNIMTVGHLLGAFPCGVVVSAVEVDSFNGMAVTANEVCSIVRHNRRSLD
jgi:hypothetical protein